MMCCMMCCMCCCVLVPLLLTYSRRQVNSGYTLRQQGNDVIWQIFAEVLNALPRGGWIHHFNSTVLSHPRRNAG